MKLQFDKQQQYQLDAIQAVIDVFRGQPTTSGQRTVRLEAGAQGFLTELGFGNHLEIEMDTVARNVREIQQQNKIVQQDLFHGMEFSVEMETGTGKTYTYLRTIHELYAKYGFNKFIIVVPSVAIREGVLKTLEITREHFEELYERHPYEHSVYDSKRLSTLRQFATSNQLQILVLNIDAFNKKENNVIHRENDRMSGHKPIEFLQSTRPIVILDESQNMESTLAKEAIQSLHPLCTLRYSATHRRMYNLLYRLGPVKAYYMKLVKRIEVDSVIDHPDFKRPYLALESISATKHKITAKLTMDVQGTKGPTRKTVTVQKAGTDLYELSKQREAYKGFIVEEMDVGNAVLKFSNGVSLNVGQKIGTPLDDIMRMQIQETIREHLEKERYIHEHFPEGKQVKVLSLFFIDRVANYAEADGKIRKWFEEIYKTWSRKGIYRHLKLPPVEQVHNGYFATDKKGKAKDTTGKTAADDEAYELIMRDKERLLSRAEPLRFIFSHSALREGWDNPNIFQICTLNETKSEMKKRQEIGRGLRLPVDETGQRLFDHPINRLTVIANERYQDFARSLQAEIVEDCGEAFPPPDSKKQKVKIQLIDRWAESAYFKELWGLLKRNTRYSVQYETSNLINRAAQAIQKMPVVVSTRIYAEKYGVNLTDGGVTTSVLGVRSTETEELQSPLPDFIAFIQRKTELTRGTIAEILIRSGRLEEVFLNAQQFLDQATQVILESLHALMVEEIQYDLNGEEYQTMRTSPKSKSGFEEIVEVSLSRCVEVRKSLYPWIEVDSEQEAKFALDLDSREDIRFFLKLPRWFKIKTPLGDYNPDWAIVKENDDGYRLHFICETKGSLEKGDLRQNELAKMNCGAAHCKAISVDYKRVTNAVEI